MIDPKIQFHFRDIERRDSETFAQLTISPDLKYLEGHFPNSPVLPAVAMIDASVELLRVLSGKDMKLLGIPRAKITIPVLPNDELLLKVVQEVQENETLWAVSWIKGEKSVAQFWLSLA